MDVLRTDIWFLYNKISSDTILLKKNDIDGYLWHTVSRNCKKFVNRIVYNIGILDADLQRLVKCYMTSQRPTVSKTPRPTICKKFANLASALLLDESSFMISQAAQTHHHH